MALRKATPEFPPELKGHLSAPTASPPFTLADLKAKIPAHCFERNTLKSLLYTLIDLVGVFVIFHLAAYIEHPALPAWAPVVLWPLYWWVQGAVCTGLWVIAHECGHRAFSDNIFLGDCVGLVLHSALLVPYHPWRISHSKHHRSTNSMEFDEVFVPVTKSEAGEHPNPAEGFSAPFAALYRTMEMAKMLLFGWPLYLLSHVLGRKYGQRTNHFEPSSPLFNEKEFWLVVISDLALVAVLGGLVAAGAAAGWLWLAKMYLGPLLIVNMWLVLITDLQHTDPSIPHYRGRAWNWLNGALCTIDRDYGYLNAVFHHIGDTHVAHHLFSTMPHYHAQEATAALRPTLGPYYVKDSVAPGLRGIAQALYKTTRFCRYVDDVGDVLWWRWQ